MISTGHLNPRLLLAEYAVRGPIVTRAQQLQEQGRRIIYCNIGNPQGLKQKPLTFIRQVLSLLEYPKLLDEPGSAVQYPEDVRERVRKILAAHPEGVGAYSQSTGIPMIRQEVADFIAKRDGIPASREQIILTDGASKGVQAVITALLKEEHDGFMIPVPQYPLYSASLTLYGGGQLPYFLDEANGWQLNEQMLTETVKRANAEGMNPIAIVVINPGNPTGAVLSRENIRMVVEFAHKNRLAILADEVYQENIYDPGASFHSFAGVMHEMSEKDVPLFSLHSVSKGFLGECGHRGGYLECRNLPADVMAQFVKLQSISLCANVPGQFATYAMVAPPKSGDESYEEYRGEKDRILNSLKTKARMLGEGINAIEGLSLDSPQGAMYAFVRLTLPAPGSNGLTGQERIDYLTKLEFDYCMGLLEHTGICVVPGAGFGQLPGTLHFRTTFLPPEEEMGELVQNLRTFHEEFIRSEHAVIS